MSQYYTVAKRIDWKQNNETIFTKGAIVHIYIGKPTNKIMMSKSAYNTTTECRSANTTVFPRPMACV